MLPNNSPVRFKPVKYIISDMDGTLIDSESLMVEVHREIFGNRGINLTEELRLRLLGRVPEDVYQIITEEYDLDMSIEEFIEERDYLQEKYLKNVQLMPGVEEFVDWFYERNIPMAVATSSSRKEVELRTRNHKDLFEKFHHITTRDEVERGKPYPDLLLKCASEFIERPTPKEVLVFEDSLAGVEAARSAGMQVVFVADPSFSEEEKRRATKAISCLSEFDPKEFGLSAWV